MIQYFIAVFKDEHIMFKINREEEDSQFFFLNDKVLNLNELDISEEFKQNFPTENELRFELLFRNKLNDSYKKNGIKFINIRENNMVSYDLIKEEILNKVTHGIPFNPNEKIKLFENKIIRINGIRLMNVKMLVLNSTGLQLYSDPNSLISDFVSIKKISSFRIDDEDIEVRYMGNNDEYHYDLVISRSINELLNTFSSETDKPLLSTGKAVQWFKDVGYNLSIDNENDDYEGIFEVPCYSDDTCNDKLKRLYDLNNEVLNLLKHF